MISRERYKLADGLYFYYITINSNYRYIYIHIHIHFFIFSSHIQFYIFECWTEFNCLLCRIKIMHVLINIYMSLLLFPESVPQSFHDMINLWCHISIKYALNILCDWLKTFVMLCMSNNATLWHCYMSLFDTVFWFENYHIGSF